MFFTVFYFYILKIIKVKKAKTISYDYNELSYLIIDFIKAAILDIRRNLRKYGKLYN